MPIHCMHATGRLRATTDSKKGSSRHAVTAVSSVCGSSCRNVFSRVLNGRNFQYVEFSLDEVVAAPTARLVPQRVLRIFARSHQSGQPRAEEGKMLARF